MRDETNTVTLDGSEGEGGGQMLRSSLSLSSTAVTRCFARARGRAKRPLPL